VMAIQKFVGAVSPVIRANLNYVYLLGKMSEKEVKDLSEEMNAISGGDSKRFIELYHRSKSKGMYDFMFLNFNRMEVMRNLSDLLYSTEGGDFSDAEDDAAE